jgi:hypothetical protein
MGGAARDLTRAALALALLAACSRERATDQPAPPPPSPYREVAIGAPGRVGGVVVMPESLRPEDVVVWLDDVRSGKPLPIARRFELDHVRERLVPKVQTAVVQGTLNVRNTDDTVHRARFTLVGMAGRPDSVLGTVEETGAGQLVPTTRVLTRPGLIVVTCDQHPATRGWIRVFDQPYFTIADSAGRFAFDSVPPGRWRLVAWHPSLGERDRSVTVDSAGLDYVEVRYPR